MNAITGGEAIARMLMDYGVSYIFGIPGGQTLPIYSGIYNLQPKIKHILVRDEKCAALMADAYARVTNRPGVCDATVGPGATNLFSGVAEAWSSSIPLIVITSDVVTSWMGKGASQECDMLSLLKPFTKASFMARDTNTIPELVRKAFRIATTNRPGPVHLDFPIDVIAAKREFKDLYVEKEYASFPAQRVSPDPSAVKEAAQLLSIAKRPILIAGGGVLISQAAKELVELAERLSLPVATTVTGNGSIPHTHPLSLGVIGRVGYRECANEAVGKADVVFAIGCKFNQSSTNNWTLIPKEAKIIHLDIDPGEIGKNYPTEVGLTGDAKLGLMSILKEVDRITGGKAKRIDSWLDEVQGLLQAWKKQIQPHLSSKAIPIKPARVFGEIRKFFSDELLLVSGASFTGGYASSYYNTTAMGRNIIQMRGMACIEYALPVTIAVKLICPERKVLGIGGDGGFAYHISELETAIRYEIPLVFVVINNSAFGWIKLIQKFSYHEEYISTSLSNTNYAKIAEAFGCVGIRVERPEEILGALQKAYQSQKPVVIDIATDPWDYPPIAGLDYSK